MNTLFRGESTITYAAIGAFFLIALSNVYLYSASQDLAASIELVASSTQQSLAELQDKNVRLADQIYVAQRDLQSIQSRVGGFESTLGTLEKLSKTDPELLQKYSKVFFLNEHYAPAQLEVISKTYLYSEERSEKILAQVRPFLENMLNAAQNARTDLFIRSAFRSFNEQQSLKSAYTVTYGAGSANKFSADQGYSEHQLGTAVDFISKGQDGSLDGFEKTKAYEWLLDNAYTFGFTLSYPANNGYYVFEPWHWRFVGVALATKLKNDNKYFYDLEQREIDTFLAGLFD